MDKIDLKILIELDKNVRQSNLQISRKLRISKDVVTYRIERLKKEGILTNFYATISTAKLGKQYYKLLIKYSILNKEKEKELIVWLKRRKETTWIGSCDGNWNLIITLNTGNQRELNEFLNKLLSEFGIYFRKKEILSVKMAHLFNEKYLYEKGELTYEQKMNMNEQQHKIDEKDIIILQELTNNGRIKATEISAKLGMSSEAVAKRIKNLIKSKTLIGFKPRINFVKLGYEYYHLFISVKNHEALKDLVKYYKEHKSCVAILEHIGYYDVHLEFVLKSNQDFREILQDLREKFGEKINEYEPLPIYSEHILNLLPSEKK